MPREGLLAVGGECDILPNMKIERYGTRGPKPNVALDKAIVLLHSEGKTFREIGKMFNLHYMTVYSRYFRYVSYTQALCREVIDTKPA